MVDAYNGAGGAPPFRPSAGMGRKATTPDGPAVWSPLVEAFLRTLR
jgi:hypothetical protein